MGINISSFQTVSRKVPILAWPYRNQFDISTHKALNGFGWASAWSSERRSSTCTSVLSSNQASVVTVEAPRRRTGAGPAGTRSARRPCHFHVQHLQRGCAERFRIVGRSRDLRTMGSLWMAGSSAGALFAWVRGAERVLAVQSTPAADFDILGLHASPIHVGALLGSPRSRQSVLTSQRPSEPACLAIPGRD